ncbi:MAG TPA: Uma2 family endonuclease [Polyangia bacterium]
MVEVPRTPSDDDQRVVIHGVSWSQYEAIRERTDHIPGLRLTYLEGALEIMSPSSRHELLKKLIARLLEVYALERDIDLVGAGSTTFRSPEVERALEPDECYCLGTYREPPDLAIEVVLTTGGLDKLAVYRGLGVLEVWQWRADRFQVWRLGAEGYAEVGRSQVLPALDLEDLAIFVRMPEQPAAVRAFRDRLRARR